MALRLQDLRELADRGRLAGAVHAGEHDHERPRRRRRRAAFRAAREARRAQPSASPWDRPRPPARFQRVRRSSISVAVAATPTSAVNSAVSIASSVSSSSAGRRSADGDRAAELVARAREACLEPLAPRLAGRSVVALEEVEHRRRSLSRESGTRQQAQANAAGGKAIILPRFARHRRLAPARFSGSSLAYASREPRPHHRRRLSRARRALSRRRRAASHAGPRPRDAVQLAGPGADRQSAASISMPAPARCRSKRHRAARRSRSRSTRAARSIDALRVDGRAIRRASRSRRTSATRARSCAPSAASST